MTLLASRVNITEEKYASNCYTIYINDNIKVNTNREYKSKLFDKFPRRLRENLHSTNFLFLSFAQMKIYFVFFHVLKPPALVCFIAVSTMKNRTDYKKPFIFQRIDENNALYQKRLFYLFVRK